MASPTVEAPAITALAPWFGGKRTLAPAVVRLLGPHRAYFEPFCGSMAVLFAKPACRHEVVSDLNRDLVNVARVLQSRELAPRLLERLHFTLAAEETFRASALAVRVPLVGPLGDVDRAYHAMVFWWLGRNGTAGTKKTRTGFSARFTTKGGSGGVRFRNLVASVPAFVSRLARVDVLSRCGFEVLDKIDDAAGTAIYCDPPYLRKSAEYEHDFAAGDHQRLADKLSRFRAARVVVSYYPDARLADLYPPDRWSRAEVRGNKHMANSTGRKTGGTTATEVLLVNGPAAAMHKVGG